MHVADSKMKKIENCKHCKIVRYFINIRNIFPNWCVTKTVGWDAIQDGLEFSDGFLEEEIIFGSPFLIFNILKNILLRLIKIEPKNMIQHDINSF